MVVKTLPVCSGLSLLCPDCSFVRASFSPVRPEEARSAVSKGYQSFIVSLILIFSMCVSFDMQAINNSLDNSCGWSSIHHMAFADTDYKQAVSSGDLQFNKASVPLFTQLILSWNVFRPAKGHFSFKVQVRNAKTKRWGGWHHVADWGATIQRSYASKSDGFGKNVHVRFELDRGMKADAFRVKVLTHKPAVPHKVKGLAVALSDFSKFSPESSDLLVKHTALQKSVYVKGLLGISQIELDHPDSKRICSAVSSTVLASHASSRCLSPYDFAQGVYDAGLQAYGSWPFSTAHAFDRCAGKTWFFPRRLNSFLQLHQQLVRGIPVVVSVRGTIDGAPKPYPDGHLLVVRGWDAKKRKVICQDSAFATHKETTCYYDLASFLRAWESSHRLVYWAEPVLI